MAGAGLAEAEDRLARAQRETMRFGLQVRFLPFAVVLFVHVVVHTNLSHYPRQEVQPPSEPHPALSVPGRGIGTINGWPATRIFISSIVVPSRAFASSVQFSQSPCGVTSTSKAAARRWAR